MQPTDRRQKTEILVSRLQQADYHQAADRLQKAYDKYAKLERKAFSAELWRETDTSFVPRPIRARTHIRRRSKAQTAFYQWLRLCDTAGDRLGISRWDMLDLVSDSTKEAP